MINLVISGSSIEGRTFGLGPILVNLNIDRLYLRMKPSFFLTVIPIEMSKGYALATPVLKFTHFNEMGKSLFSHHPNRVVEGTTDSRNESLKLTKKRKISDDSKMYKSYYE
jgi:hypothetical protein